MGEEEPRKHAPHEIVDVETIHSLDTARLALRWALERLQKMDAQNAALLGRVKEAEDTRAKAVEEYAALERSGALRVGESQERESYYAKLEEFLSLQLQGKLDLAALAKREAESASLKAILDQRLVQIEKDLAVKRQGLEKEHERLKASTEQEGRALRRQDEAEVLKRKEHLEAQGLALMQDLRLREARLKSDEKTLAERQKQFADYYEERRAQLEAELKNFRAEVEDQIKFRLELSEKVLDERRASLESGWTRERAMLAEELERWKTDAQELAPRVIHLETELAQAWDEAARRRAEADRRAITLEESRRAWELEKDDLARDWEKERKALEELVESLRAKHKEELSKVLDLGRRLSEAEDGAEHTKAAAEREISAVEERKLASKREKEALRGEIAEWKKRVQEALAQSYDSGIRLAKAEEALLQERAAAAEATARDAARQEALKDARREAGLAQPLIHELEKKLAASEGSLRRAEIRAEQDAHRFDEERSRLYARLAELEKRLAGPGPGPSPLPPSPHP